MTIKNFKILSLSFCILIFPFSITLQAVAAGDPGTLIVKIKSQFDLPSLSAFGSPELLFDNVYRLRVSDLQSSLSSLEAAPWVEFAEQDAIVKNQTIAADPLFTTDTADLTRQWYLSKIQMHQAWDKTTGSGQVIVAIIDTGVDGRHEDLNDSRVGRGFINYCQVTSPENDCLVHITGLIDPGANSDDNGHGTIVAGLIGALPNNNRGISGVAWQVKFMPIKALDSTGSGLSSDVATGIRWAADNGARIINMSLGGAGLAGTEVLQEAVTYAYRKGVLIIAAAGNDNAVNGNDLNLDPVMPVCADGGENMVLGVAAVDSSDVKAKFSNFGSNCIDISAPGTGTFVDKQLKQGMISTYYDPAKPTETNLYAYVLGTSVAAPIVTGVAALMMSAFPDLDAKAVRDRLIASVDNIDAVNGTACISECNVRID